MNWLITGVGSGIGKAVAEAALARGDAVVGIVRRPEVAEAFAALNPGRARSFLADVCDRAAVFSAVDRAFAAMGSIDVVLNNAGQVLESYVEEGRPEEVRALFEVNFIGPLNVVQAALPHLRKQGSGLIANVSSGGGILGVPAVGLYCASKFALEGMSEALAQEVKAFGIDVTIIEPGAFRTNLLVKSRTAIASEIPAYDPVVGEFRRRIVDQGGKEHGDPARLAQAVMKLADAPIRPLRLPLGDDAMGMALAKAASIVADVDAWRSVASGLSYQE